MRVVLEPKIEAHDPELYSSQVIAPVVAGYDAVDAGELDAYERQGFLVIRGAYTASEVQAARNELDRMTRADDPDCESVYYEGAIRESLSVPSEKDRKQVGRGVNELAMGVTEDALPPLPGDVRARFVRKFMGFTDRHEALGRLAYKPEMLNLVKRLLRENGRMYQDMAMIKPPGGREKPWHQDHAYFNLPIDTRICGLWIALGDVNPQNGCMYVLSGGHRDGPRLHFRKRDWQICDTDVAPLQKMCVPMLAGDALLFDAKLPHGTPTNKTNETRWAVQLHYVPQSAVATDDEQRLAIFGSEGKNVTC